MPIFECRALEKRYGAAMALDHIDLALEPGRIVGLLGPNGSGKSTLVKLAMGLLQPTSGEVLIGGQAPSPQTNAVVSYLPDRITLSPWMKTRQLLDFYGDFFADFDRAAAERMLSQLGLDLNQSVRQMSKGMKEKVQLVLTMSRRAKLYLLDEPIGGVDPAARDYILNTIIRNYNEDATMILSTHLIHDIEAVFDDVVMIGGGHIVLAGSVDAIREERDKSIDTIFREVFRCWGN